MMDSENAVSKESHKRFIILKANIMKCQNISGNCAIAFPDHMPRKKKKKYVCTWLQCIHFCAFKIMFRLQLLTIPYVHLVCSIAGQIFISLSVFVLHNYYIEVKPGVLHQRLQCTSKCQKYAIVSNFHVLSIERLNCDKNTKKYYINYHRLNYQK